MAIMPMTVDDFAASIVWYETGVHIDHRAAMSLLWEHSGFPSFWLADDPKEEIRQGILDFLRGVRYCERCGRLTETVEHARNWGLCDTCRMGSEVTHYGQAVPGGGW